MVGRNVEVRSGGGMCYYGIVRSVRAADGLGELFELGAPGDTGYQRLVYVADRAAQIRELKASD
jgi:hypothetical protein